MSRKFDPRSQTYQMFEKLFLELEASKYPFIVGKMARGRAINLAQGLNSCQQHWAQKQGVPKDMLKYSAKAKQHDGEVWIVEISNSPKHTNTRGKSAWLAELTQQIRDAIPDKDNNNISIHPNAPAHPDEHEVGPDSMDNFFAKYAQGASGIDEGK